MIAAVGDVFDSGFLTYISLTDDASAATAFFPVLHENRVIAVMLVASLSIPQLPKETLDLHLAIASLIGTTYSRNISAKTVYQAKEEWEQTFEAVPDMIALIDTEYRIVRVNRAMAAKLGMSRQECAGLTCHRAIHGEDRPPAYCPCCQVLEDGMEHAVEIHEERLGGDFFMTASPLHDKEWRLTALSSG